MDRGERPISSPIAFAPQIGSRGSVAVLGPVVTVVFMAKLPLLRCAAGAIETHTARQPTLSGSTAMRHVSASLCQILIASLTPRKREIEKPTPRQREIEKLNETLH